MEKEPSPADWQKLCEAALHFKEAAPPGSGLATCRLSASGTRKFDTIGYCSVLGNLGDVFGLVAYLGSEGLVSLSRVARAKQRDTLEAFVQQNCLSLFFGSRSELTEKDRDIPGT